MSVVHGNARSGSVAGGASESAAMMLKRRVSVQTLAKTRPLASRPRCHDRAHQSRP